MSLGGKKVNTEKAILIKIAHYYYEDNMTQSEIGERMGMSRQRVNRLIKSLRSKEIIKIEIASMDELHIELEKALEKKFNLKRVVVAHVNNEDSIIEELGKAGARFISQNLARIKNVGVSWGKTLYSVAEHCTVTNEKEISVVQLVGGTNSFKVSDKANEITRLLATNLGGNPYYMYAPVIVESEELKESFMNEKSIQTVFDMMSHCDMAFVGIGELGGQSTIYEQEYIGTSYLQRLVSKGAVGDLCFQMVDIKGELINNHKDQQVVGISNEQLKAIPEVVGIAGGLHKVKAITGALNSGLVDVLITDSITAQAIMEEG